METVVPYLARWIHIASAITLLGGMIFAALAWLPGLQTVAEGQRESISDAIAAKFRPWLVLAVVGLLASGFYNYLAKKNMPPVYHMLFGMKFLLALHVFSVGYLSLNRGNAKRGRQIVGVVISGLVILALSAGMRQLSLNALAVR